MNILRRFNLPNKEWMDLGLSLGLLYPSLTDIQEREPKDCLRECIAKWLRVDISPTLLKLCNSLRDIGYSDVALLITNISKSLNITETRWEHTYCSKIPGVATLTVYGPY